MNPSAVHFISLPKILDNRGNLSFVEEYSHVPFKIKRTYWIYDVPGGETRGGHSYKTNQELIIALSGSFTVVINDGTKEVLYGFVCSRGSLASYGKFFNQFLCFGIGF